MKCAKCYQRDAMPNELYCSNCLKLYNQKSQTMLNVWQLKNHEALTDTDYNKARAERFEQLVSEYRGVVENAKKSGIIRRRD